MKAERSFSKERGRVTDRVYSVISQVCSIDPAEVSHNAPLLAFGIDSVRLIELMLSIEEEFQINLEPAELSDIVTVGQLTEYLEGLCASKGQS